MARREWNVARNGQFRWLAKSAGFRRNPQQHAGTGATRQEKTPTENGWGFIIGGGTRNRTRVRFQNQIVTHGSLGRGFDDLAEPQLGATSRLQRSSNGDLTPGRPAMPTQITQTKLADCFLEFEKGVLLSHHIGKLKDSGNLAVEQISVGKLNNVREAVKIVSTVRSILGGDGVTNQYPIMRHMMNLESVRTYEGTDEVHALVVGKALTGEDAFR